MIRPHRTLSGPVQRTKSGSSPQQLFFILHGWGSDGTDFLDLAISWSHDFPNAEFHMPNGPDVCSQNPSGYQWFSLESSDPNSMLQGAERAAQIVEDNIAEICKNLQISSQNVVILGFSQGGMLALHIGLTRPHICKAVACYSGQLIKLPNKIEEEKIPILLIHGENDDVIPIESMLETHSQLKKVGIPLEAYRMINLGHSINEAGIDLGCNFFKQHLTKDKS